MEYIFLQDDFGYFCVRRWWCTLAVQYINVKGHETEVSQTGKDYSLTIPSGTKKKKQLSTFP